LVNLFQEISVPPTSSGLSFACDVLPRETSFEPTFPSYGLRGHYG
jgi:hypothetical protein